MNVRILSPNIDVLIGLHPLTAPVREGETFSVCAELMSGSLERSAIVTLEAMNNSAIRTIHMIIIVYPIQPMVLFYTYRGS